MANGNGNGIIKLDWTRLRQFSATLIVAIILPWGTWATVQIFNIKSTQELIMERQQARKETVDNIDNVTDKIRDDVQEIREVVIRLEAQLRQSNDK